jgi:porin
MRISKVKCAILLDILMLSGMPLLAHATNYTCDDYNKLNNRAESTFNPMSTCDSISTELWGARAWLADKGVGIQLNTSGTYSYDLLAHNADEQLYGGQDPNYKSATSLFLTYDLSRLGWGDAQFVFSGVYQTSNYQANDPNLTTVSAVAVNQRFLNDQLEVQYGFWPLIWSFYGYALAGSSTSALGPSSMIPVEVGLSYNEPTPAINVTVRDPSLKYYNQLSLTRSNSSYDVDENHTGLKWDVTDASLLYIDEFGFKQEANASQNSIWARAGFLYNTTDTTKNLSDDTTDNYGGYLAGTFQITKPYNDYRGLYGDMKYAFARSSVNLIDRDFSMTLFDIGLFETRPADMIAFGYSKSFYSDSKREAVSDAGGDPSKDTQTLQLSYSARVVSGLYAITSFSYTKNPTFAVSSDNALIFQEQINFWF